MRSLIFAAALALAIPALAQERGDAPKLDTETYVKVLREQRDAAQRQASDAQAEYTAAVIAFRKRAADLDAYLKACGDKPGCTVPVTR